MTESIVTTSFLDELLLLPTTFARPLRRPQGVQLYSTQLDKSLVQISRFIGSSFKTLQPILDELKRAASSRASRCALQLNNGHEVSLVTKLAAAGVIVPLDSIECGTKCRVRIPDTRLGPIADTPRQFLTGKWLEYFVAYRLKQHNLDEKYHVLVDIQLSTGSRNREIDFLLRRRNRHLIIECKAGHGGVVKAMKQVVEARQWLGLADSEAPGVVVIVNSQAAESCTKQAKQMNVKVALPHNLLDVLGPMLTD